MPDATDLDFARLRSLIESLSYRPLFVTVSGAHLYGFPSPDSDIDLRGCHQLSLAKLIGLHTPDETLDRKIDLNGREIELVSHDLGKYLRLLVKNNGYVLEQIFSPLVVSGQDFLNRLQPIAKRCINRQVYHHYRGFLNGQLKLLEKENPKKAKTLLYAYRVVLSGIHLLRSGVVETDIRVLSQSFQLNFVEELIGQKRVGEFAATHDLDWPFHRGQLADLEAELARAFEQCTFRDEVPCDLVNEFLIDQRLS